MESPSDLTVNKAPEEKVILKVNFPDGAKTTNTIIVQDMVVRFDTQLLRM